MTPTATPTQKLPSKVPRLTSDLSGFDLAYSLFEAFGSKILGGNKDAFLCDAGDTYLIISKTKKKICQLSLDELLHEKVMEIAKDCSASFEVCGEDVVCTIRNHSESAPTYGEAATRALIANKRVEASTSTGSLMKKTTTG